MAKEAGVEYRNNFGQSNSYILDSLRGLKEILLFNGGQRRLNSINEKSRELNKSLSKIKDHEGVIRGVTDLTIMLAILTFVGTGFGLLIADSISFIEIVIAVVIVASSFGPVVALSNLSNNLLHTFACAERLFALLDEEPNVEEVAGDKKVEGNSIKFKDVEFSYTGRQEKILDDISININKGVR